MELPKQQLSLLDELVAHATIEVNKQLGLPEWKDQSGGNQCHALTYYVMTAMEHRNIPVRRELHRDEHGNWHYVLVHTATDAEPADTDIVSDLNPWQWQHGEQTKTGILHAPRGELMERLRQSDAPEFFVALRSLETIVKAHERILNFGGHI